MPLILDLIKSFMEGYRCHPMKKIIRQDKKTRQEQTEQQIDKMLKDSFPASDPPSSW